MIITIPHLLSDALADKIVADLSELDWRPGETYDAEYGSRVKRNEEIKEKDHPRAAEYGKLLLETILTNEELRRKALTYKAKIPQFNRYSGGAYYGKHSDSVFMGLPEIRTDLSLTIFLSNPSEYDGGELTLDYASGELRQIKEAKGTIVCYPSDVLHYVTPVTRGTRYAAVSWIQSFIRAPHQRAVLASLLTLSERIKAKEGVSDTYSELLGIQNSMLKMWSEF